MQSAKIKRATSLNPARPAASYNVQRTEYRPLLRTSSGNLKEQVGLLLWGLQSPLSQKQRRTGYRFLEALLSARYSGGEV